MPYLTILEFPDIDQQRYDELSATSRRAARHSASCFTHAQRCLAAGEWETPTALDQFIDETLPPAARALGWPEPSTRECFATYRGHGSALRGQRRCPQKKIASRCRFPWP